MVYFAEVKAYSVGSCQPTGDRKVDMHHTMMMLNTWRAYVVNLDPSVEEAFIKEAEDAIESDFYNVSKKDIGVCIRGHIERGQQETIERLVINYEKHLTDVPIRVFCDYFSILGDEWVQRVKEDPKQISLF
ncbi:MAG: hypothetical protein KKE20_03090 [Nanoarchaeota archaeon]|nr:hypothetical protein [Nanoarchaeota archaeon]